MSRILTVLFAMTLSGLSTVALCQSEPKSDERVEAFVAGIRELNPRAEDSAARFQALVQRFVPAGGPVGTFLEFMEASGFTCPWVHSLAPEVTRDSPSYRCQRNFGSAEPSSSIREDAWFSVTANCDAERNIVTLETDVFHGVTGL